MFDWNHDGKIDGLDHFMDFMIFNEVMKDEKKKTKAKGKSDTSWINKLEDLDAIDDD